VSRCLWGAAGLLGLAVLYCWQPQRLALLRRRPRANPWTDPDSGRLFQPGTRVCLLVAHPDDAEFYAGGLLCRLGRTGARLSMLIATDGDKGYQPFQDASANRRRRREEQEAAARLWSQPDAPAEIIYLGYRDASLHVAPELAAALARELRRIQPDYILTFDADYPHRVSHRDHLALGRAAAQAVRESGVGEWLLRFGTCAPNFALEVAGEWDRRGEVLRAHRSQFSGLRGWVARRLIIRAGRIDGRRIGASLAEGLRCERLPARAMP
jgi:LmbE family N-acetylglucosaminyl deacetylase